ncbi:MAG: hypothetical protein AB1529_05505 [Candidatus Micrarchaeota archaeon]
MAKVLDFNSAYGKRHGREPLPALRQAPEPKVEAIIAASSGNGVCIVAELDLEDRNGARNALKNVRAGEGIRIRAGRGVFEMRFTHLDEQGRLVAMLFNNGRYEGDVALPLYEEQKVWGGMRMDMSLFRVAVRRLPYHFAKANGVLGCVHVSAETEGAIITAQE